MTKKHKWLYFFIMACAAGFSPAGVPAQGTEVGLRLDVDKRQVEVGEQLTLTIEFKQIGSGNSSVIGQPSISTPEHFEIRGQSSGTQVSIVNQQTAQVSTTQMTLLATKAGTETLGPALLLFQDSQLKKREIKSNVVTVTVTEKSGFSFFGKKKSENAAKPAEPQNNPPSPNSPDELRGLKPLLPESFAALKPLLLLLIAGAIAGFVWWQYFKTPKRGKVSPPPLGRAAQLREKWKKLTSEDLGAEGFCLVLSSLVRECLQYRYLFDAVDLTTGEILKELNKRKISNSELEAVEKCLKACDRVLYADGNLTGRDNLRSLCSALLPKVSKT